MEAQTMRTNILLLKVDGRQQGLSHRKIQK